MFIIGAIEQRIGRVRCGIVNESIKNDIYNFFLVIIIIVIMKQSGE